MQTGKLDIVKDNIDNIYAYVDHLASTPMSYKDENGDKKEDTRLTGETGTLAITFQRIDRWCSSRKHFISIVWIRQLYWQMR